MEEYWPKRLGQPAQEAAPQRDATSATSQAGPTTGTASKARPREDAYDRTRRERLEKEARSGGWKKELRRYLDDPAAEVTKDTDTVKWWEVSPSCSLRSRRARAGCISSKQTRCVTACFCSNLDNLTASCLDVSNTRSYGPGHPPYSCSFCRCRVLVLTCEGGRNSTPVPTFSQDF